MSVIPLTASNSYNVEIAPGLLDELGQRTGQVVSGRTAFVLTDDRVEKLHLPRAVKSLEEAGFQVYACSIGQGEQAKCGETYLTTLNLLAQHRLTRSDVIVALGGGIVGDLAGFTAATYLRGIAYVQVPTTLLAMVDSSVGGKTAINLPAGKNLAGAFYQPRYVLCDPELLSTLPPEIYRDGLAEVIKYAILSSPDLFSRLMDGSVGQQEMIEISVNMKKTYVAQDEFDRGQRQFLNLGHTLGHAVEVASGFTISHGHGVAVGTAMIARAAAKQGFCTQETSRAIETLLLRCGLPVQVSMAPDALHSAALGDKKRQGDKLTLVVPQAIGQCMLHTITTEDLPRWIQLGGQ